MRALRQPIETFRATAAADAELTRAPARLLRPRPGAGRTAIRLLAPEIEAARAPRRFFRPEIEAALKMLGIITLAALIVLPLAWGYEQRRQARSWQTLACAYRVREIARRTPVIAGVEDRPDPCATLERLGFELDHPR